MQAGKNQKRAIRILLLILLFNSLFILSGCWNNIEISDRAIVIGTGIDTDKDGQIKVIVQLVQPVKVKKKEDVSAIVLTSKGETTFEAIRNFAAIVGRKLLWTHLEVIIVGPNVAEKDLLPFLDFLMRDHEARPKSPIFFTAESIEELLKIPSPFEPITAVGIAHEIKANEKALSYAPLVKFYEFNKMMLSSDGIGYAPIMRKTVNEGYPLLVVEGMVVFNKGERIGNLNKLETRGVLWVKSKVKGGVLVIPIPQGEEEKENRNKITLEILGSNASIKPELKGEELTVTVDIESTMNIGEIIGPFAITENTIKDLEKEAEKEMIKEIKSSLAKTQEWKTDIYGINNVVHRKYTDYWKKNEDKWGDIFSELAIKVNAKVKINNSGFLKHSLE